jgi:outer membrane protein assembly factor BamE (lipoprotein component of BamABCDE complex)
MKRCRGLLVVLMLAGCASFDGRTLRPGQSTAGEVTGLMGVPAMELKRPNGDTWMYFPRHPFGRATYVATIGADGVLRGIEQRLNEQNIRSIGAGMRREEVLTLLGPPREVARLPRQQREVWEYPWTREITEMRILWVQFSDDGVVREALEMHDEKAQPGASARP